MQTYFAQSPLGAGQTSRSFTLPGGQTYLRLCQRDTGAILADGSYDANLAAIVTLRQLAADGTTQNTLLSENFGGASSGTLFIPDTNAGVLSLYNAGPGDIRNVSISDLDVR